MANQIDEKVKEYPKHPSYSDQISEYDVWRNTLNGGQHYIDTYLEQYTVRESTEDFNYRAAMTVNPAFAEGAVTDIKNAIFQRFTEIRRVEGDDTYRIAIDGLKGGVDNFGRSMNSFIGDKVLIELIGMGKVGVYIDMPVFKCSIASTAYPKQSIDSSCLAFGNATSSLINSSFQGPSINFILPASAYGEIKWALATLPACTILLLILIALNPCINNN